ncbi:hypothetical protein EI94DRAFT_1801738 [Lactarius quietus]|nr:hypothetical protein EI94DRAFT_1801738 [Lactarius quietus]
MPELKRLVLYWAIPKLYACPTINPNTFNIERTVTLPSLTHLDISAFAEDCALALAHFVLPALTIVSQHSLVMEEKQQNCLTMSRKTPTDPRTPSLCRACSSVAVRGSQNPCMAQAWYGRWGDVGELRSRVEREILDIAIATLPLDSLVTLTAQRVTPLDNQLWLRHTPRWSLLQRVRLAPPAARGFREMLLQDNSGRECPLLPSLTTLDLIDAELSGPMTFSLCDILMKRVEQGVPLETLDLHTCRATSHAVRLLGEIVVNILGPAEIQDIKIWGRFVPHNSQAEYYSDRGGYNDDQYTSGYGEEWNEEEMDVEEGGD